MGPPFVMFIVFARLMRSLTGDKAATVPVMAIGVEGLMRPLAGMSAGVRGAIEAMMPAGPQGKAVTPPDENAGMRAMPPEMQRNARSPAMSARMRIGSVMAVIGGGMLMVSAAVAVPGLGLACRGRERQRAKKRCAREKMSDHGPSPRAWGQSFGESGKTGLNAA